MNNDVAYEVETRFYFELVDEAMTTLPFLKDSLQTKLEWETSTYGLELFHSGKLLRVSEVNGNNSTKIFWGYKEADIGQTCNIRIEQDEEITDGLQDSSILKMIKGKNVLVTPQNVNQILNSLGHEKFMSFTGTSLVGKDEKIGLSLKLMTCHILEYPVLLEIEKITTTLDEALQAEIELQGFIDRYDLKNRVVRKEPVTLLYEKVFGR